MSYQLLNTREYHNITVFANIYRNTIRNPFQDHIAFLYPLKTLENQFSGGIKMKH